MSDQPKPIPEIPLEVPYADRPAQYGIILETSEDGVRITIPPRFFKMFLRPIVIELDAGTLKFEGIGNGFDETDLMHERPGAAIYDIKYIPHSGNLFIKAHGFSFFECRPHRDPEVVKWIAEQLNAALRLPAVP